MKSLAEKRSIKKWKKGKGKEKTYQYKLDNYEKGRKYNYNHNKKWNMEDLNLILYKEKPDSVIVKMIGRSVQAIQVRRSLLGGRR